jgi:hypothetical protein
MQIKLRYIALAIFVVFIVLWAASPWRPQINNAMQDTLTYLMNISTVLVANPTFQLIAPYLVFVSMVLWFLVGAFLMKNWTDFKQAVTRKQIRSISGSITTPSSPPSGPFQKPPEPPPKQELTT